MVEDMEGEKAWNLFTKEDLRYNRKKPRKRMSKVNKENEIRSEVGGSENDIGSYCALPTTAHECKLVKLC